MNKLLLSLLVFFIFHEVVNSCGTPQTATINLPPGGIKLYTQYMQGELNAKIPKSLKNGSPIVSAIGKFPDGNYIIAGVLNTPDEFHPAFFWVFNPQGEQYPDWTIDNSDYEDFDIGPTEFDLNGCTYIFQIKEKRNILD